MKITKRWLKAHRACSDGYEWFASQKESEVGKVVLALLKENHFNWANWVLVRFLSHKQSVIYAAFAAKQVLHIFEKKHPKDKRPRNAINAALKWAENPSELNRCAAAAAAAAAYAAAGAAAAAAAAAAYAAAAAAAAAYAGAAAAAAYAGAAAAAGWAMLRKKILRYGIKLLQKPSNPRKGK